MVADNRRRTLIDMWACLVACVQCMCMCVLIIDAVFDASSWAWFSGAVLFSRALSLDVNFDLYHALSLAWQSSSVSGAPRWNGGHSLAGGEAVSKVVDCVEVDLLNQRRK